MLAKRLTKRALSSVFNPNSTMSQNELVCIVDENDTIIGEATRKEMRL